MKVIFYLFGFVLFCATSCKKECEDGLSECMATKIDSFKNSPDAKAVLTIELDNDTYYWFNTDATFFDGVEYIYDNKCDQACYFCGECVFPDCTKNFPYDKTEWNVLWMK